VQGIFLNGGEKDGSYRIHRLRTIPLMGLLIRGMNVKLCRYGRCWKYYVKCL